ncbi:CASC1 protein-like [Scleropages formosus]|uniref:Dynein axonemal intermediate chain 7 n=1 Tax=Scleropages formosus TaxID=113540 RepID=A0A0N8K3B7_SCLFO|nr:CASC1 protein-like [Scleropages formosus]
MPEAPKKKKGKVSKEEKEKLKREEEERRQKEEEEARLLAEQEELRRLEKEQREEEERLRLEQKDSERRGDELNEVRLLLEERQSVVTKWEADLRAKAKWDHYMHCDGRPDPSVQQEINSYISLWIEDPKVKIGPVLEDCTLALQLIEQLEDLFSDRRLSRLIEESEEEVQKNQETLCCMQRLIQVKQDLATEEILKHSSSNMDIETGNMQTVFQDANTTLCLWANLNKNPRQEACYYFQEVGFGFELPKQLATCDVAVRILHTRYDHLSPLSLRAQATRQGSTVAFTEPHPPVPTPQELEDGEVEKEGHAGETTENAEEDTHSARLEAVKQDITESKEPVIDTVDADVVELDQFTPLGGVFHFHLFQLPPQSKVIGSWELRELLDSGLKVFPYPVTQSQLHSSFEKIDEETASTSQPVGVTVTIPNYVTFLEDPQVARWDTADSQWRKDLISDIIYDKSSERISFQMDSFYSFTLIQETYINMPFQSWELQPLGLNEALLTVIGAVTEVSIRVKDHQCMLVSIQGSELPHVTGKWMHPSALQKAMSSSGVNIFVKQHSEKYVSISAKDPSVEQMAYEQMALTSSAVAFSWSRWNSNCGEDHVVVQACEHLDEGPVPEQAWSLFLVGAQRSKRLQMKEQSEHFSTNLLKGSEFHSTFLHMLRDGMSEGACVRLEDSSHFFVDCVLSLLQATRVLTHS